MDVPYDALPLSERGTVVVYLNAILIGISIVTVSTRLYIRGFVVKNFGADDWVTAVALAVTVTFSALEIKACYIATGHRILTLSIQNIKAYTNLMPTMELCAMTAGYFTRLAILLFLRRLVSGGWTDWAIWGTFGFMTAQFIALFCAWAFQCKPVWALWHREQAESCLGGPAQRDIILTYSAIAVALDFGLWIAPVALVTSRLMYRKMKMRMIAVFSVGAFACIAALLKLIYTAHVDVSRDFSYHIYKSTIFHDLEPHVGLIVGCFPALHPLFRWLRKKVSGQSTTKESSGRLPYLVGGGTGRATNPRDVELYSMNATAECRTTAGNDSQEAMVEGRGIFKSIEVDVTIHGGTSMRDDDKSSVSRSVSRRS
ncbi:hypothetical protein EDC01DRAFT_42071 [Geopyxis carbonaria]|nr:hypothetical protein EDC01DRAFT_42071 [Geopyxis carbonaria]